MTAPQRRLFALLLVVVFALNVVVTRQQLTAPYPGHNDFLSVFEPARSYLVDGIAPYSAQSNLNLQTRMYGRAAQGDEIPNVFAYPHYTVFLVAPLVPLAYDWASALWMVTLEACLIAALALLLDLYRWRPRPLTLALLVLWLLLFYPAARSLILGQVGVVVFLMQVIVVWALWRSPDVSQRDALIAGVALALTTFKPQMSYLFVPFVLLWSARLARWRVIAAFALVFGGLMALSFIVQPTWLGDWLYELGRYPSYTAVGSPVWVVTRYLLNLSASGEWLVNAALYTLLVWTWLAALIAPRRDLWLWTGVFTLALTHLVAPRTATTHFVVFTLPLFFWLARWARAGRGWLVALVLAVLLVVPWLHFITTVSGELEHPATYLPIPIAISAALWLTRRTWWSAAR